MAIRVVLVQAFGSKAALVDWMVGLSAYGDNVRAGDADVDAAANRAHAARRWHPSFNISRLVLLRKTP
jgi:hypothetical protein